jgi:hypothetical protein
VQSGEGERHHEVVDIAGGRPKCVSGHCI